MALSGLEIYKLLPKTNCRECGFPTCLAFAMQLAKKAVTLDKCPHIKPESKTLLESASLPPIKLVTIGPSDNALQVGNETVMFRHEEKFRNPAGVGLILNDDIEIQAFEKELEKINRLVFERVGQTIKVDLVALKNVSSKKETFLEKLKIILQKSSLNIVLISQDAEVLKASLELSSKKKPLIYAADKDNFKEFANLAKEYALALVIEAENLESLARLSEAVSKLGVSDLILSLKNPGLRERLWDFTQIRRLALRKRARNLGYPVMAYIEKKDKFLEPVEASTFIAKYANIVLLEGRANWQILPVLTLRQNIYTDPQKPLQIEPKIYSVSQVTNSSPLLVTTNFSLTYYTVLGEIEASKVPSYILSVDTEGMSVLTAWAAEKFTSEKIVESLKKFNAESLITERRIIIPGYVAVMSGDLEEKSGWKVVVGPREAAGIPAFLKNL